MLGSNVDHLAYLVRELLPSESNEDVFQQGFKFPSLLSGYPWSASFVSHHSIRILYLKLLKQFFTSFLEDL
jgi:hypothetical protein